MYKGEIKGVIINMGGWVKRKFEVRADVVRDKKHEYAMWPLLLSWMLKPACSRQARGKLALWLTLAGTFVIWMNA